MDDKDIYAVLATLFVLVVLWLLWMLYEFSLEDDDKEGE